MAVVSIDEVKASLVDEIDNGEKDSDELSLDALVFLINSERLRYLQEETLKEFKSLKERQDQVAKLHELLKKINAATDENGNLEIGNNQEIKDLLNELKDLGIDTKDGKVSFNKEERERLVENIRMTVDDLNVQNEMQIQTISRLTNDRYESYQMARSIFKPLDDTKKSIARGMAGK